MAKKTIPKYTVLQDTREQKGWYFGEYDKCAGMEQETLKTGDYTIKGFEDMVCIERKFSVEEIANNLGKKKKAFDKEMQRMQEFAFKYIICEFSMSDLVDYPNSIFSDYMKQTRPAYVEAQIKKRRITGKYLLRSLMEYQNWYGIHILFCDNKDNAFLVANSIFKRLNEMFHEPTE
tara:strand:- start:2536 stop:3063 length:528 start_codon:yes stop_codon:yes gene_type:complete